MARKEKVNPLKFWHLVECVNGKNGMNGHMNGNGKSYARNGHVN
ncbi:MAG: hypothetical protein U0361_12645 [Nitrospiraceae bacterium]